MFSDNWFSVGDTDKDKFDLVLFIVLLQPDVLCVVLILSAETTMAGDGGGDDAEALHSAPPFSTELHFFKRIWSQFLGFT